MKEKYRVYSRPLGSPLGTLEGCDPLGSLEVEPNTPLRIVAELARERFTAPDGSELIIEAE